MIFGKKKTPPGSPSPFVLTVAGAILVLGFGLRVKQFVEDRQPRQAEVTVAGQTFAVDVADTPEKRALGLGKRDGLAEGHGMYFPMGSTQYWTFWMKDMRFPIDIVWIRDGKVVDISADVPIPIHEEDLPTYAPREPADAVLELQAGTAAEIGLEPDAEVRLDGFSGG